MTTLEPKWILLTNIHNGVSKKKNCMRSGSIRTFNFVLKVSGGMNLQ